MHHLYVHIHGRVQGVGFRYFVWREASALGLAGTVRNLPDGSVAVESEGDRATLERLLAAVRRGPPHAEVAEARVEWSRGPARFAAFHIGE